MPLDLPNFEALRQQALEKQAQELKNNEDLMAIAIDSKLNPGAKITYFVNKNKLLEAKEKSKAQGAAGLCIMPLIKVEEKNGKYTITEGDSIPELLKFFMGNSAAMQFDEYLAQSNKKETDTFGGLHGGEYEYKTIENANFYAVTVMKKIPKSTINEYLEENSSLSEEKMAKLLLASIKAIEKVHLIRLVHGDIKFGNLMVVEHPDGEYEVNCIDFGETQKKNVKVEYPPGSGLYSPVEIIRMREMKTLPHPNQDIYSLLASLLHHLSQTGNSEKAKIFLGEKKGELFNEYAKKVNNNEKEYLFEGENHTIGDPTYYISKFAEIHQNMKSETSLSKLLCSKPSKLNINIITSVKMQLHNIILASKKPEELDAYFKEKNILFNDAINKESKEEIQTNSRILRNQYFDDFHGATESKKIEIIRSVILATIILENPKKSDDYLESQTQKLSENIDKSGDGAIKIQAINVEKICKTALNENSSDDEKTKAAQMAEQMNKKFEELNDIDKLKSHAKRAGFGTRLYNGISNFASAVVRGIGKVAMTLASPLVLIGMFAAGAFEKKPTTQVENNNGPKR